MRDLLDVLAGDPREVAPALLGARLTAVGQEGAVTVRLSEVEAYCGQDDPGSHACRGRTARNASMFEAAGTVYVYFTYGMHYCVNVVTGSAGAAGAVLLRAGEIVEGIELARRRRPACRKDLDLARGPARLATCLALGRGDDGRRLGQAGERLHLRLAEAAPVPQAVRTGPRVGVSGPGGDGDLYPWRFWIDGDPTVSQYRPATPRRKGGRTGA